MLFFKNVSVKSRARMTYCQYCSVHALSHTRRHDSLHCVSKKVPTFKLSVTLPNLNRFSKILYYWKAYENLLQNPYDSIYLTLVLLLLYLAKFKNQIFCRCGRKHKQNAF